MKSLMPRHPRLFLPDIPLHVVQRGHNRQPVFVQCRDFQYYLSNLFEMKLELSVRVFGYCLMTNHVHLIVAPGEDVSSVSMLMRSLAARQTRYVNKLENRTGTLWEGRFKASLVDSDTYFLACCRYVDLNPLRAAVVSAPEDYPWSSYRCHAGLEGGDWLDEHDVFSALGNSPGDKARAYREFVAAEASAEELAHIRQALQRNQLTGTRQFRNEIAKRTGLRVSSRGRGRPGKNGRPDNR